MTPDYLRWPAMPVDLARKVMGGLTPRGEALRHYVKFISTIEVAGAGRVRMRFADAADYLDFCCSWIEANGEAEPMPRMAVEHNEWTTIEGGE